LGLQVATRRARTAYISGAPEFIPSF